VNDPLLGRNPGIPLPSAVNVPVSEPSTMRALNFPTMYPVLTPPVKLNSMALR
jgi:hypothetical protein